MRERAIMMGTFMKGVFIVGLATFNWALAAPVTTPSSLNSPASESANTLVTSPGLSQMKMPFSSSGNDTASSQPAAPYPDYGSYDAPVIVSGNSQNIAMLQTIKSDAVLY